MSRYATALLLASFLAAPLRAEEPLALGPPPAPPAPTAVTPPLFPADALPDLPCTDLAAKHPYQAGACSVQLLAGYFPMTSLGPSGPSIDYSPFSVRAGVMLNDPNFDRLFMPGTCELLFDYTYARIHREVGSYWTGPSLIFRYTHCVPEWLVHPYVQVGAGFNFNDVYSAPVWQELIGERFEFLLRAELGVRCMLTENLSFDVEAGFQHISNACLAKRNGGINNAGFAVGLTYSFGRP